MARALYDSELFAEELESLLESVHWTVWTGSEPAERAPGAFKICEHCGMLVCDAAVRHSENWPDGNFTPYWWEPGLGRLHTPRRCRSIRDLHERRVFGPSYPAASGILPWRHQVGILHYGTCCRCGTWRWKHRFLDGQWGIACQGCVTLQDSLALRADPDRCAVISGS